MPCQKHNKHTLNGSNNFIRQPIENEIVNSIRTSEKKVVVKITPKARRRDNGRMDACHQLQQVNKISTIKPEWPKDHTML